MEIQVVNLTAVDDIKTARKHRVGVFSDLVNSASAKNVDDLNKIVRMSVGGDVTDIFFDQHAFLVDEMRVFFINSHEIISYFLKCFLIIPQIV